MRGMPPAGDVSPAKLRIEAFRDTKYRLRIGVFVARINPNSYTHDHTIRTQKSETAAQGSAGAPSQFSAVESEVVSFDIIFDGTGIVPGCKDVVSDIAQLKRTTYYFDGEIHRTAYLRLVWGSNFKRMKTGQAFFTCQLTKLSLKYSLFKPDGTPLRAIASVAFEEFRTLDQIAAAANKRSPDLTHNITVRHGDTLPMLCYKIYNDEAYYLEVAKINNLISFRDIKPGQELIFPPLKR